MKTTMILAAGVLTFAGLFFPTNATAGMMDSTGTWEGSGMAHAADGSELGAFTVSLARKANGNGKLRADGKVTLANGQVIVLWQEIEDAGANGFRITSNNGTGGGRCFGNGMCTTYEQRPDGHAFATTIARDTPDKIRLLITELDKGQAVRFIDQTLTKKP